MNGMKSVFRTVMLLGIVVVSSGVASADWTSELGDCTGGSGTGVIQCVMSATGAGGAHEVTATAYTTAYEPEVGGLYGAPDNILAFASVTKGSEVGPLHCGYESEKDEYGNVLGEGRMGNGCNVNNHFALGNAGINND